MASTRRVLNRALHRLRNWVEVVAALHPDTDAADRFGRFGLGSCIAFPAAALFNESAIHLGENTLVGRHCSLSVASFPEPGGPARAGLVIGDRCVIGARTTITAHESVVIGDDVWFGQNVFISDASHGSRPADADRTAARAAPAGEHRIGVVDRSRVRCSCRAPPWDATSSSAPDRWCAGTSRTTPSSSGPAKMVRRYVPEIGWVATDGSGDVRPPFTAAEVEAVLTGA